MVKKHVRFFGPAANARVGARGGHRLIGHPGTLRNIHGLGMRRIPSRLQVRVRAVCSRSLRSVLKGHIHPQLQPLGSHQRRWQPRPAARGARLLGLVLACWVLFGASVSWAGTNAPMCGADATTMEAPPPSPNAKSGKISALCSPDLKRLLGAADEDSDQGSAIWVSPAQVDHAVLLATEAQLLPLPQLLAPTPPPSLAPAKASERIYRPPRG